MAAHLRHFPQRRALPPFQSAGYVDAVNNGIYERLDVHLTERGESFYQPHMVRIARELQQSGHVWTGYATCTPPTAAQVEDDGEGRMVLWPEDRSEGYPLIITKSDGGARRWAGKCCFNRLQGTRTTHRTWLRSTTASSRTRFDQVHSIWLMTGPGAGRLDHLRGRQRANQSL